MLVCATQARASTVDAGGETLLAYASYRALMPEEGQYARHVVTRQVIQNMLTSMEPAKTYMGMNLRSYIRYTAKRTANWVNAPVAIRKYIYLYERCVRICSTVGPAHRPREWRRKTTCHGIWRLRAFCVRMRVTATPTSPEAHANWKRNRRLSDMGGHWYFQVSSTICDAVS